MIERTTVRLPKDLLARAKRKALAEDRTLTSLIEEGLRLVVSEKKTAAKTKRVLPRHSDASGPPFPGIDVSDSAALQEREDIEYVERLKHGFK
jgi:hypothetical protein